MVFIVLCENHEHLMQIMRLYYEKLPTAVANTALNTIETQDALIRFQFVTRDNGQSVMGMESDGTLMPPGFIFHDYFTSWAHQRARFNRMK